MELIGKNIDSAMLLLDQAKILQAIDGLITLTDFICQEADKPIGQENFLPSDDQNTDKAQFKKDRSTKSLANALRHLLLRI